MPQSFEPWESRAVSRRRRAPPRCPRPTRRVRRARFGADRRRRRPIGGGGREKTSRTRTRPLYPHESGRAPRRQKWRQKRSARGSPLSPARAPSAEPRHSPARPKRAPAAAARGRLCAWSLRASRTEPTLLRHWRACRRPAAAAAAAGARRIGARRHRRRRSPWIPSRPPAPRGRSRRRSARRCDRGARAVSSTGCTAWWLRGCPRREPPRSRRWRVPSRASPWAVARQPRAPRGV